MIALKMVKQCLNSLRKIHRACCRVVRQGIANPLTGVRIPPCSPNLGIGAMSRNKIEFKVNDDITYAPYEKEFDVKVIGVDVTPPMAVEDDERIFYEFKLQNLKVVSSGLCIKESIYYEEG